MAWRARLALVVAGLCSLAWPAAALTSTALVAAALTARGGPPGDQPALAGGIAGAGDEAEVHCEARVVKPRSMSLEGSHANVGGDAEDLEVSVLVCAPIARSDEQLPLFAFSHGDFTKVAQYKKIYRAVAAAGFVTAAYRTCEPKCPGNGAYAFVELLKIVDLVTDPEFRVDGMPTVDPSLPIIVGGHSTGGRAALMAAAVTDSPEYLRGTEFQAALDSDGGRLRKLAARIGAAVALHPDPMYDPAQNPDVPRFPGAITKTPIFEVCSGFDYTLPPDSCWYDFRAVSSPDRIYWDMPFGTHEETILTSPEAPWVGRFARAFALGDAEDEELMFGDCDKCFRNVVRAAVPGELQEGAGGVSLVVCSETRAPTADDAKYCSPSEAASSSDPQASQ